MRPRATVSVWAVFCRCTANHRQDIETCYAGDIAAAVGLKNTTTGDTLCDEDHPVILESMEFPEPVIRVAMEPKTKAGQEKMGIALAKLAEEDPTFHAYTDEETGQTIIAGMGELHLEIIVDRLLREFKVEANVGKLRRSLIRRPSARRPMLTTNIPVSRVVRVSTAMSRSGSSRTSPARAMSLSMRLSAAPSRRNISRRLTQGIQGAMHVGRSGRLSRLWMSRSRCTTVRIMRLTPLKWRLRSPVPWRLKRPCRKGDPVLQEPIMKVVVTVPEDYMGDVIGDLNSRRGMIQGMEAISGAQQITAHVPLSEMFGYATDLRSKTQGRGQYVMEPSHYTEVPKSIAEQIISTRSKKD